MTSVVENEAQTKPEKPNKSGEKRNRILLWICLFFVFIGIGALFYWLFIGRFYVSTEDAYVSGNMVMLTPEVTGGVVAIYADDTDLVSEGEIIIQLDPTDFELKVENEKANLANTVRDVTQLFEAVKEREAELKVKKAELSQAKWDYEHRQKLSGTGAISQEDYEKVYNDFDSAQASYELAKIELEAARMMVAGTTIETHPRVLQAVSNLRLAFYQLIQCQIRAPTTGYIAKRTVQVGDYVLEGATLLFIIPLNQIWIEANYRETSLSRVRIGQPVSFHADIYGRSVRYHGHVIGFSPGTGSAFSILPPQNASGNWIKIIQRVPVRISINPQELDDFPLLIGLSLFVTTNVHDTTGPMLARNATDQPVYKTSIYSIQMRELASVNDLITKIIQENSALLNEQS